MAVEGVAPGRRLHLRLEPTCRRVAWLGLPGVERAAGVAVGERAFPGRLPPGLTVRPDAPGRTSDGRSGRRDPGRGIHLSPGLRSRCGALVGVPSGLVGVADHGSGPSAGFGARSAAAVVNSGAVRLGVGTRMLYDGELVEVVETAATTAGNEVVLKDRAARPWAAPCRRSGTPRSPPRRAGSSARRSPGTPGPDADPAASPPLSSPATQRLMVRTARGRFRSVRSASGRMAGSDHRPSSLTKSPVGATATLSR